MLPLPVTPNNELNHYPKRHATIVSRYYCECLCACVCLCLCLCAISLMSSLKRCS